MNLDFSNAVKMIIAKDIKVKGHTIHLEKLYFKETIKDLKDFGYEGLPDFLLCLIVLERMKRAGEIDKNNRYTLQRNPTNKELKFLSDNQISWFFGDFEVLDEEYYIKDFSNMIYMLDFDISKGFLYAKALRFEFPEEGIAEDIEGIYAS